MIAFHNSITIDRSRKDTFEFLSNFENVPKWNYYVTDVKKQSGGSIGAHTVFHQVRRDDEQSYEIVEFQPLERITVETRPGSSLQFRRTFILHGGDGPTELEDEWELDTGHSGILEKLASKRIRRAVFDNLSKLKELLETGGTVLQDGRAMKL
jgi:hypothetical protein